MTRLSPDTPIAVTGAAGLVGQNLLRRLAAAGHTRLRGVDKDAARLAALEGVSPRIELIAGDLAEPGIAERTVAGAEVLVLGQAQITGTDYAPFERNSIEATRRLLEAGRAAGLAHIVHLSSSVVRSQADDHYTRSKRAQEAMVLESGLPCTVLRPTLMFGEHDAKHLGWLRRFLERAPAFPVPGDGGFIRQPLYVQDFCAVIEACMAERPAGEVFDISGLEKVTYIEIIRTIRRLSGLRTPIVRIPYRVFWALLWAAGKAMRKPPFTTQQLEALVIPELFPEIDWPGRFGVRRTPFAEAMERTFAARPEIALEPA